MKAITLKIDEKQLKLLEEVSISTHIPKSALIRKGIDLVLHQSKEDVLSPKLRQEIEGLLIEDKELLKRLAQA